MIHRNMMSQVWRTFLSLSFHWYKQENEQNCFSLTAILRIFLLFPKLENWIWSFQIILSTGFLLHSINWLLFLLETYFSDSMLILSFYASDFDRLFLCEQSLSISCIIVSRRMHTHSREGLELWGYCYDIFLESLRMINDRWCQVKRRKTCHEFRFQLVTENACFNRQAFFSGHIVSKWR